MTVTRQRVRGFPVLHWDCCQTNQSRHSQFSNSLIPNYSYQFSIAHTLHKLLKRYKAERSAGDTTYTLQPRDEGEDGGVLDFECFVFLLDEKMPLAIGFEEQNGIELLK